MQRNIETKSQVFSSCPVNFLSISIVFLFYHVCLFLCGQDAPEVVTRETWMTELPPELQHIGLGARTFKKRSGPEKNDRSIWTDTPADRERKARVIIENLTHPWIYDQTPSCPYIVLIS